MYGISVQCLRLTAQPEVGHLGHQPHAQVCPQLVSPGRTAARRAGVAAARRRAAAVAAARAVAQCRAAGGRARQLPRAAAAPGAAGSPAAGASGCGSHGAQQDVGGVEVAVHDGACVNVRHAARNVGQHAQRERQVGHGGGVVEQPPVQRAGQRAGIAKLLRDAKKEVLLKGPVR